MNELPTLQKELSYLEGLLLSPDLPVSSIFILQNLRDEVELEIRALQQAQQIRDEMEQQVLHQPELTHTDK